MPDAEPDDNPSRPGYRFEKRCKKVYSWVGLPPHRVEAQKAELKRRFDEEERKFIAVEDKFRDVQTRCASTDLEYRQAEKRYNSAKKAFRKKERRHKQEDFNKAVYFLGMNLELREVLAFATLMSLVAVLGVVCLILGLRYGLGLDIIKNIMFVAPLIMVVPLAVFIFVASYPEILAKRVRVSSLGRSPEAINYMTMSMHLTPSLSRAIEFAADNADEPLATGMKRISWNVFMRKTASIEEAFLSFAYEWGEWNEDFKRALYAIRSSTLEQTADGLKRSLDRASNIILVGTRKKIEEFAASLSGPTTFLFAMCVLLPMIIGAMLPMMALNLTTDPMALAEQMDSDELVEEEGVSIEMRLGIVVLMDFIFPFVAFVFSWNILGKRPGTSTPPSVPSRLTKLQTATVFAISVAIAGSLVTVGVMLAMGWMMEGTSFQTLSTIPMLLGVGIGSGLYLWFTTHEQKKRRDEIIKMENEFPDALFQLGSRIAEGYPLELAMTRTAEAMPNTLVGELFGRVSFQIRITRMTLDDILFGKFGVLNDIQSRTINASMKIVVETVKKDAVTAGQTIISMSEYLKDMKQVEHDIKIELGETVGMMTQTGMLFAPLVMGITSALYVLLFTEFGNIPGAAQMIDPEEFFAVVGVYLILAVMVSIYYSVGIQYGGDSIEFKYNVGIAMAISVVVYSVATVFGVMFFIG